MKKITTIEIGLLVFLAAMIVMPFVIVSVVHSHVPYTDTQAKSVRDILVIQGIEITSVQENRWNMPGALGGDFYSVTDSDGQNTLIMTQEFADETSRDAAVRNWHASQTGRGRINGDLLINGRQLVLITPANRPALGVIGQGLALNQE